MMVQNVKCIWKKIREQANAHPLELLKGKLTHMSLANLHTWGNSGIIILLLKGSSIIISLFSHPTFSHKWSMHPLGSVYIWECSRSSCPALLKRMCEGILDLHDPFLLSKYHRRHEFYTWNCVTGSWKLSAWTTEGSYNIVFQLHQIFLPQQIHIPS